MAELAFCGVEVKVPWIRSNASERGRERWKMRENFLSLSLTLDRDWWNMILSHFSSLSFEREMDGKRERDGCYETGSECASKPSVTVFSVHNLTRGNLNSAMCDGAHRTCSQSSRRFMHRLLIPPLYHWPSVLSTGTSSFTCTYTLFN